MIEGLGRAYPRIGKDEGRCESVGRLGEAAGPTCWLTALAFVSTVSPTPPPMIAVVSGGGWTTLDRN